MMVEFLTPIYQSAADTLGISIESLALLVVVLYSYICLDTLLTLHRNDKRDEAANALINAELDRQVEEHLARNGIKLKGNRNKHD